MRLGVPAVIAGLVLSTATAEAVVPRAGGAYVAPTLLALPAAHVTKPLRVTPRVEWGKTPSAAWNRFAAHAGGSWRAMWDSATGAPKRIYGSGIPVPGSVADPAIAERAARAWLAAHVDLLAPGAAATDFQLASNVLDRDMRVVGFYQFAGGRRVVGGQVSFRFKRDRLFVIGDEALPNVSVTLGGARIAKTAMPDRVRASLGLPRAAVSAPSDEVILPLVADDGVLGYRVASAVHIDNGTAQHYTAYADPTSGEAIALVQEDRFAAGTLDFLGIDRYPAKPRVARPAPFVQITDDGMTVQTDHEGAVPFAGPIVTSVSGQRCEIVNKAVDGTAATTTLQLSGAGQTVTWDASAVAEDDAQLQAYLDLNIVKDFVAAHVDANMPHLQDSITVNVNIDDACNAFFDGTAVNFFHATTMCQNTALVQDVIFHEFGHDVHTTEIIPGVGAFDGAMSEGAADFLAVNITNDSGMGRGFFYSDAPLRELNPMNSEARWPDDIGEIHTTGLIFGGTFWDMRAKFIAQLGFDAGVDYNLQLYLGALRRSVDIPSSLIEVLATDDDDGDLSNGTPNECLIRDTFGAHGLRTVSGSMTAPATLDNALNTIVQVNLDGLSDRCASDAIDHVVIDWVPRGTHGVGAGTAYAAQMSPNQWWTQITLLPYAANLYRASVGFADGSQFVLADNRADTYYELWVGAMVPLYCTNFEDQDPFANGWTTGTSDGMPSPWTWGTPTSGATDPHAAFSGTKIIGQNIDGDYAASSSSYLASPKISTGNYSDVHVQYRRWLAVEDSQFDQARITANGEEIWVNATQNLGDSSSLQHIDKEWRFIDVPVNFHTHGHDVTIGWDLTSDGGLQFGGWSIDDVCIVANPNAICGDGAVESPESCDAGSANSDDAGTPQHTCRSWCQLATCGDGIVDVGEECDTGSDTNTNCSATCTLSVPPKLVGCDAAGGAGLLVGLGALVLRRRRR
ncbi:MAG TPA: hypothetical protein VGM88_09695 [Kofleriaceae bacterium]|jgi:hypothetical protein